MQKKSDGFTVANHVSQPMAARLKVAGWEYPVEKYVGYDPIPLASIGELLAVVPYNDLAEFYQQNVRHVFGDEWSEWLYETVKRPDALAEVWLFTQNKGG